MADVRHVLFRSPFAAILLMAVFSLSTGCNGDDDGGGDEVCVDPVVKPLQVSRFTGTGLTTAEATSILADGTNVLQTNDGAGDVACCVALELSGTVTTFATGDGSIDSNGEFSAVNNLPGNIKVVNQINWCGGIAPNIIGCAPVPGNSLVVVRFTANQEGILWTHEYGHNQGLSHRNDTNAIMNPTIGTSRRRVNSDECNAFSS